MNDIKNHASNQSRQGFFLLSHSCEEVPFASWERSFLVEIRHYQ